MIEESDKRLETLS